MLWYDFGSGLDDRLLAFRSGSDRQRVASALGVGARVVGGSAVFWGWGRGGIFGAHGEGDAFEVKIDLDDADFDDLANFDHFFWVADESIGELRDMNEAVLMNTEIDKGSEVCNVGHDAFKFHADR